MGTINCYCAICGATFNGCAIGSLSQKALERRARLVQKTREALEAGRDPNLDESEEQPEEEEEGDADDEASFDEYEEDQSYDPRLVSEDSLTWLETVYCLRYDPKASGPSKVVICGPGEHDYYTGTITVRAGDEPWQPEADVTFACFNNSTSDYEVAFPFHGCCIEILAIYLGGSADPEEVDNQALFEAMEVLSREDGRALEVDYGRISGPQQVWECIPGEEFSVSYPPECPEAVQFILNEIATNRFNVPRANVDPHGRAVNDPFSKLPFDVLHTILRILPAKSTLAFLNVSPFALDSTQYQDFWKRLILWDMPWLWELEDVLASERRADLDYKGLYLWLDKVTTPSYGMEGPLLAISNRRRIWEVCEQIGREYFKKTGKSGFGKEDKSAREILSKSVCSYMPRVAYPGPVTGVVTNSIQWVYSFEEIRRQPSMFKAFWNPEGALIGLSVSVGPSQRVFGHGAGVDEDNESIRKEVVRIAARDWIAGLILSLDDGILQDIDAGTAIKGIVVELRSGKSELLGDAMSNCTRHLAASEGNHVVGIVGHLRKDHVISSLGLLECPLPVSEAEPMPVGPSRPSWISSARPVSTHAAGYSNIAPIWSHPSIQVTLVGTVLLAQGDPRMDFAPQESIIWALEMKELQKLHRISALKGPEDHILGLRVEYIRRYWEPKRYIGTTGKKKNDSGEWVDCDDDQLVHFDVDGPDGEYVTEVGMTTDSRALLLRTNRRREATFGGVSNDTWESQGAPEGDIIVGLAMTFMKKVGPQEVHSPAMAMSSVMLLTLRKPSSV